MRIKCEIKGNNEIGYRNLPNMNKATQTYDTESVFMKERERRERERRRRRKPATNIKEHIFLYIEEKKKIFLTVYYKCFTLKN